jgi:hypothetical protein
LSLIPCSDFLNVLSLAALELIKGASLLRIFLFNREIAGHSGLLVIISEESVLQIQPVQFATRLINIEMPFKLLKMDVGGMDFINEHFGPLMTNGILSEVATMIENVDQSVVWGYSRKGVFYLFFVEDSSAAVRAMATRLRIALSKALFRVSSNARVRMFARLSWTSYPEQGNTWRALQSSVSRKVLEEFLLPLPEPRVIEDGRDNP